ncbi:MAG: phage integrase N-terminal SAM-like domain-containing protein [Gammaproteobacteria bacterium]|nr:phage integrase N-terminal SAM-like domain-containing protein [Gammaproteobacteria bacterium]
MDDYEKYEAECKQVKAENEKLLEAFESWLKASGLSENTIHTHFDNIDFYINYFLLYEDVTRPEDGAHDVSRFLGYWFIRKAMWSSPSTVKSSAASLKKFYTFLLEKRLIESAELNDLKASIKEGIYDWMERAKLN